MKKCDLHLDRGKNEPENCIIRSSELYICVKFELNRTFIEKVHRTCRKLAKGRLNVIIAIAISIETWNYAILLAKTLLILLLQSKHTLNCN